MDFWPLRRGGQVAENSQRSGVIIQGDNRICASEQKLQGDIGIHLGRRLDVIRISALQATQGVVPALRDGLFDILLLLAPLQTTRT